MELRRIEITQENIGDEERDLSLTLPSFVWEFFEKWTNRQKYACIEQLLAELLMDSFKQAVVALFSSPEKIN